MLHVILLTKYITNKNQPVECRGPNQTKSKVAHLEHKHLPPEKGHCVKIAITDVGFSIARRGPVTIWRSRRTGLTVIFPVRISPPWWEGWERPSWLQHCSWDTWEVFQKQGLIKFKLETISHSENMSLSVYLINCYIMEECDKKLLALGSQTYRLQARNGPIKVLI